jgi:signal transduction histidine kinase/ligand-binding sensor domain-containing protein
LDKSRHGSKKEESPGRFFIATVSICKTGYKLHHNFGRFYYIEKRFLINDMKTLITFLCLLITTCSVCHAQAPRLSIDKLTTNNGLQTNVVNAIVQDDLGYMWFGTFRGVVRYDGYENHVYKLPTSANAHNNDYVNILFKDRQGSIWAGTYDGAFKYDRNTDKFIRYGHNDSDPSSLLYNNVVNFFQPDDDGIWIVSLLSTYERVKNNYVYAISHFDFHSKKFTNYGSEEKGKYQLEPGYIRDLFSDRSGKLWLVANTSIYCFNKIQQRFIKTVVFDNMVVYKIYQSEKEANTFYMLTNGSGLLKFNTRTKSYILLRHPKTVPGSIPGDLTLSITEDKQNQLWVGTPLGMSLLNEETDKFTNYLPDKKAAKNNLDFSHIKVDAKGYFWFIGENTISYFDPRLRKYKVYPPDTLNADGLNERAEDIFIDRTNTLWFLTRNAGVSRVNTLRSAFNNYRLSGKAFTGNVSSFLENSKNSCYLCTTQGLYLYNLDNQTFKKINYAKDADINTDVSSIARGKDGNIAIGNRALTIFNPDKGTSREYGYTKYRDPFNGNLITAIIPDSSGKFWLGTVDKGLQLFDPRNGKFTRLPFNDALSLAHPDKKKLDASTISTLYKDKGGTIWIGTFQRGLSRFNPKDSSFTSFIYRYPDMIDITALYEDSKHNFWVGTDFNGLYLFDRATGQVVKHFMQSDGLLSDGVDGIIEDNKGRLWLSNSLGLAVLDLKTYTINKYTKDNGLPTNNLNWPPYQMSDGRVLYSTLNNFLSFSFDDLKTDPYPPQVYIENIMHSNPAASNSKIDTLITFIQKHAQLPYNQNRVTFNFVALHYNYPFENQYAYRLDAFDKNWISTKSQRSITYNNLSPGTYIFRVKAANSDGIWNQKGDTFTLVIDAPWWLRWWAGLVYIVLFAAGLYTFVNYRSRRLLKANQLLEEKVTLRTHQLNDANHELNDQKEALSNSLTNLKQTQIQLIQSEKMASLGELTAGIAHEIQNPLNFVNNFSEVSAELIDEMDQELDKGDIAEAKAIGADLKQNLEKIRQHGKRADSIVKGMLEHSRTRTGEKLLTDLNGLCDEFLKLSYHGLRAKDKNFNAEMVTNYDANLPKINIVQQDLGRVLLNLFNNAFYAVNQKQKTAGTDYKPEVMVTTSTEKNNIVIKVKDNGNGIPDNIKDKIMQPFFTTKPTGEGTGLGLSLSYDIVVKGHGGRITIQTVENEFSEFIVEIPL